MQFALGVAKAAGIPEDKVCSLGGHVDGRTSFSDLINEVRSRKLQPIAVRPAHKDTLAYLVFSSGTSGLPKGRALHHFRL